MRLLFSIPSKDEVEATCIQVTKRVHLRDGTLGEYSDAKCKHCSIERCNGHVGYIQLPFWVMHPIYFGLIPKLLSCMCQVCHQMAIPQTKIDSFDSYLKLVKMMPTECSKKCKPLLSDYNYLQGFRKDENQFQANEKDQGQGFFFKSKDQTLSLEDVRKLLTGIECSLIGFHSSFRPENLVVDYLLVMPNNARNNLSMDGDSDVHTRIYEQILRHGPKDYLKTMNLSIELVGRTAESDTVPMARHMLTSKSGLMRSNLMCSRQNRSARSVISTDSYIPLSHVGVPEIFRDKLTVYVYLDEMSVDTMVEFIKSDECVATGNLPIQGVELGEKRKLKKLVTQYRSPNYYVERSLRDDDWVFINRQPTLHRHSILAFRVRLVKQRTIVLNLACVTAFNADFDGDEITLYVASDRGSIRDCQEILAVEHNIVSPEDGSLVIFPVQDCITGTYKITQSEEPMPELLIDKLYPVIGKRVTTPREIFDTLCPVPYAVPVDKSELKKVIKKMGSSEAIDFVTKLQIAVDLYLKVYPLSVRYTDFNPLSFETVKDTLEQFYFKSEPILNDAEDKKSQYPFYADQIESKICMYLDGTVKESILNHILELAGENDLIDIIQSGAKGKKLDLVQSWVALCQQYVFGRQQEMYGTKLGEERRGFVTTCYGRGLDEAGMFYQATAARSTIINTGVNTADPGYLQRQLSKFMSDVIVDDEHRVINHEGVVLAKFQP